MGPLPWHTPPNPRPSPTLQTPPGSSSLACKTHPRVSRSVKRKFLSPESSFFLLLFLFVCFWVSSLLPTPLFFWKNLEPSGCPVFSAGSVSPGAVPLLVSFLPPATRPWAQAQSRVCRKRSRLKVSEEKSFPKAGWRQKIRSRSNPGPSQSTWRTPTPLL